MNGIAHDEEPPRQTILCPHCVKPIGDFDHFCPHCGGQVTAHGAIDPLGQVYAAGNAYRNATSASRPKLIVVLGIWLIFAPAMLLMTVGVLSWSANALLPGFDDTTFASGGIGVVLRIASALIAVSLSVLYAAILWQTTRRYVRHSEAEKPPNA